MEVAFSYNYISQPYLAEEKFDKSQSQFTLNGRVLVLNQSYEPITVCSVKKAMLLLFLMKAEIIAKDEQKSIHSISRTFPYPSVIKLFTYMRIPFREVELSRKNIFRRDSFSCQYCGEKTDDLTIDHIIPRSRGGDDTWENLVAACHYCNNTKGNLTPNEAGMHLLSIPRKPHHIIFIKQFSGAIDEKWRPFLFMD